MALVLDEAGGNVAEAARRLGVARKTLYARRKGR
ncbi:MAG TPA: helix-turn-helix domain-containing protein [Thermoanaerobaculia bacterium]|nr:helix-turn-helix domain-containing protein [Thermoanaerobaculia bacterium]